MSENRKIKLYSQDWSKVVFETECPFGVQPLDAEEYLRASGHDWLGLLMEFGDNWKQRWSGQLELKQDGTVEAHRHSEFLKHIMTWPTIPDTERGLYPKYELFRVNDDPDHHFQIFTPFFVLRYDTDPHAREALAAYAESCEAEYPKLAADLRAQLAELGHIFPGVEWKSAHFQMQWDANHTFPFIEDEYACYVFGYGHQDKAEFARLVNKYDELAGADLDPEDHYDAGDVRHVYAAPCPKDAERFTWRNEDGSPVLPEAPGAFPLTLISRCPMDEEQPYPPHQWECQNCWAENQPGDRACWKCGLDYD